MTARPLRRVCIQLSIRLKFPLEVIETWPLSRIREYIAVLSEQNAPSRKSKRVRQQTPEEMVATFGALINRTPKE